MRKSVTDPQDTPREPEVIVTPTSPQDLKGDKIGGMEHESRGRSEARDSASERRNLRRKTKGLT